MHDVDSKRAYIQTVYIDVCMYVFLPYRGLLFVRCLYVFLPYRGLLLGRCLESFERSVRCAYGCGSLESGLYVIMDTHD